VPLSAAIVGRKTNPIPYSYDFKACILYALGIGAKTESELDFLYEGSDPFKVFPTFSVVPGFSALIEALGDLDVDLTKLLHGEHAVKLYGALPEAGTLSTVAEVTGCYDKGKAALVVIEATTTDEKGKKLFTSYDSLFIRGAGGFGGERGPEPENVEPDLTKTPDFEVSYKTTDDQATLYRLSGDLNPIHINPQMSAFAGFKKPILHGLCTYGHVGRAFLHAVCGSDPAKFGSLAARFSGVVFPGDTITVRGWKMADGRYTILANTDAAEKPVITNCVGTLSSGQESVVSGQ
jgi:acyl dehydratase